VLHRDQVERWCSAPWTRSAGWISW
jgi:hypothetical protein